MINLANTVFTQFNTISRNLSVRDRGTDSTHDALPQMIEI